MFTRLTIPLRAGPTFPPPCSVVVCACRRISASAPHQKGTDEPGTKYEQFIEGIGKQFEKADRPRNWLGGDIPFPMNPSFKPPIPLSDALRTTLYQKYMADPVKNSVRELARQHHLSIKRVDAILRLKGLEESWVKSKPLQTGFRVGMEKILGVEANAKSQGNLDDFEREAPRKDVDEADLLDENEGDWARQKYRRMFWESIPEGDHKPVMPASLQQAREDAEKNRRRAQVHVPGLSLTPPNENTGKQPPVIVTRPGRSTMKFVDVGEKFVDVRDRMRRMSESERRKRIKERKRRLRETVEATA